MNRRVCILAFALIYGAALISDAASVIIGNLPQINDNFGAAVEAGVVRQALSFTMPAESHPVGYVALRLRQYNTSDDDTAAVGFYTDNGSDAPGSLFGELLKGPASSSDAPCQFYFLPPAPLTLNASAKYWLVVDAADGIFAWTGSNPPITPTSQVGAVFGRQIGLSNGIASFEIGTSIPEPRAIYLLFGAMSLAVALRIRFTW